MGIIYPPRPKTKITPTMLPRYEGRGIYLAQRKFNGDRCLVHYPGDGRVELYNQEGRLQKYRPTATLRKQLLGLNLRPTTEYWLDGELMNVRIPDTMILYDVLQAGTYLYGVSLTERLRILAEICRHPTEHPDPPIALMVDTRLWMAESFHSQFTDRFREFLHLATIEGLVLKESASLLDDWGSRPYETKWQVRCRKPGPNYQY